MGLDNESDIENLKEYLRNQPLVKYATKNWSMVIRKEFMFDIDLNSLYVPEEDQKLCYEPYFVWRSKPFMEIKMIRLDGEPIINNLDNIGNYIAGVDPYINYENLYERNKIKGSND